MDMGRRRVKEVKNWEWSAPNSYLYVIFMRKDLHRTIDERRSGNVKPSNNHGKAAGAWGPKDFAAREGSQIPPQHKIPQRLKQASALLRSTTRCYMCRVQSVACHLQHVSADILLLVQGAYWHWWRMEVGTMNSCVIEKISMNFCLWAILPMNEGERKGMPEIKKKPQNLPTSDLQQLEPSSTRPY